MRNVSDKIVEKIKTHILFSVTFLKNLAVYEIIWGKKYCRAWHSTDDNNGTCALHAGLLRLKTHTQNM
jgi:hypothetical protein